MKRIGFDKLDEDRYYNEWYGMVTERVMKEIRGKNLSPADYDRLALQHGGLKRLDTYLRDND